jgi:hypothetical protein
MKKSARTLVLIPALLLATLSVRVGGQPAAAQTPTPPDFSGVSDILHGRRELLRVDDIVLTSYNYLNGNTNAKINVAVARTQSGNIDGVNGHDLQGDYPPGLNAGFATAVGRMFDLPRDVVVTLGWGTVSIADYANPTNPFIRQFFPDNVQNAVPNLDQSPMADFTGDGLDDLACIFGGHLYVITPNDVTNIDSGLLFSEPGAPPFDLANKPVVLAAGDFDGDGAPEVALTAANGKDITTVIYTAQVTKVEDKVTAIALTAAGSMTFSQPNDILQMALVAGAYTSGENTTTGLPLEDLVLMYHFNAGKHHVNVLSLSVMTTTTNSAVAFDVGFVDNYLWQQSDHEFVQLSLVSDRLDFFGPTEQLVAGALEGGLGNYSHLAVFTLDDTLKITKRSEKITQENQSYPTYQMTLAVGNFDQGTSTSEPLGLEVAVMKSGLDYDTLGSYTLYLYNVNVNDPVNDPYGLTEYASRLMGQYDTQFGQYAPALTLRTGDTQGRSLLLGPPTKITVEHAQPRIILGMPPQHVDWMTDANGNGPEVLNLSAVKGGFYSSYQTSVTDQAQSSSQSTTSWTHSVSETASFGYRWGGVDEGSVNLQVTESAGYMHNETVSKKYDTYASTQFNVSSQTGFDDNVWYNDERHNVYIYPVIGQTACPAGKPNCSTSERQPLNVMFSGPDQITQTLASGGMLEWFQPVWEPGNLFSYPSSLAQLEAQSPNQSANLLTSATPTEFFTDGGPLTVQATWERQTGSTSTSGVTNNVWWGANFSVSKTPPKDASGFQGSISAAYNGSTSMSTMNTSTTKIGQSTGVGIAKPGTFPNPGVYAYGMLPFIFGNDPVTGTVQKINLGQDIQTSGILQAGFVADLTAPEVGSWWSSQYGYTQPDLALNHPQRWNVTTVKLDPSPPNCVRVGATSTTVSCASFNAPESDIWNSEFYRMRGLFITPVITPTGANGDGPQITQAIAGDRVRLQARVYNYSLTETLGTPIVQFYGQPWNTRDNTPDGNAFLIDQVELPTIPGYGGAQPNWVMASTDKLDTAAYNDQFVVFWVFVWMQDANGNLIPEMPGHGITDIPGTFSSIIYADDYLEDYSNNVGLYHSVFYIAPLNSEPGAPVGAGDLTIEQFAVEPKRALLNEKVSVSAMLHAGNQAIDGVSVKFYDGDPAQGGKLFDVENVAHIRANEGHQVRVPFRAETCGLHTLYVTTHPQAQTATTTLKVRVKPLPVLRELIRQTKALELPKPDRRHLLDLLREARQFFRQRDVQGALSKLAEYRSMIEAMRGTVIPVDKADMILAQVDLISSCVGVDLAQDMTQEELMEDQATDAELAE